MEKQIEKPQFERKIREIIKQAHDDRIGEDWAARAAARINHLSQSQLQFEPKGEKPPVSDEPSIDELQECEAIGANFVCHDFESAREAYKRGQLSQRDADVAYYEPIIQQLEEESGSRLSLLNIMTDKCTELRTSAGQAKAEVAREIFEWGEQPCIEHSEVEWPNKLGGGTVKRQKIKRRRCQHCWPTLKSKYLKEENQSIKDYEQDRRKGTGLPKDWNSRVLKEEK